MGTATNAVVIKKAMLDALEEAPEIQDVQVSYGYPGPHVDRKLIHGGKVEGVQRYPVMRGGGGRHPRQESLTFKVHIVVSLPGADVYEVELACTEIGDVLADWLASHPDLGGNAPEGVLYGGLSYVDLDSDSTDDGAIAVLTLDASFESRLR